MTNSTIESVGSRKVIRVSCSTHGGPAGFASLVLRKLDGEIELDPHAAYGAEFQPLKLTNGAPIVLTPSPPDPGQICPQCRRAETAR